MLSCPALAMDVRRGADTAKRLSSAMARDIQTGFTQIPSKIPAFSNEKLTPAKRSSLSMNYPYLQHHSSLRRMHVARHHLRFQSAGFRPLTQRGQWFRDCPPTSHVLSRRRSLQGLPSAHLGVHLCAQSQGPRNRTCID
jgi:hypothetical protein